MEFQVFNNTEFGTVRTVILEDEVYFVGKEVAKILGYAKPLNALTTHVDVDDSLKWGLIDSMGRMQETIFINESGLYSLILSSKLPNAKKFKRWVTSEVLPALRKHGGYLTPEKIEEALINPDTIIRLATAIKDEQNKNKLLCAENAALSVENAIAKPKAEYFDEICNRNLLTNFRETAAELGVRQQELIEFLLNKKYVYRDKKGKLMPYAKKNNNLFEVKECFNDKTQWIGTQTLITPKGRDTFRRMCLS